MNLKGLKALLIMCIVLCLSFAVPAQAATTPARVQGLKVVNSGKTKQTLSWKKIKGVSGYEVYSKNLTSGTDDYKKIKTLKKASKVSLVVNKRKPGNTYVYKVRAFKKSKGTVLYGKDSIFVSATMPSAEPAPEQSTTEATEMTETNKKIVAGPSEKQKYKIVFGDSSLKMRYPGGYYTSAKQAKANMQEITVKTWDFKSGKTGEKITRTWTISVHRNLATTVEQIFKEIYNGQEKFPIHELGGYAWRGGHSEHNTGTAIDINWTENYMVNTKTGVISCGKYWKPGKDPYSIPKDGEVARIFGKYGFAQGDWGNSKDYMHFSYFHT